MANEWSLEDDRQLLICAYAGKSRAAIGYELGRTVEAVSSRLTFLRKAGVEIPPLRNSSTSNSSTRLRELRAFADSLKGQP